MNDIISARGHLEAGQCFGLQKRMCAKNQTDMKKILFLLIPLLAFSACTKERGIGPDGPSPGEVEVGMTFVTSGVAARASIVAEDALKDITILVVGADGKYQYKKDAWTTGINTFKSNLKIASGLTLYITANAKAFLNSPAIAAQLTEGTDWSTIEPLLIMSDIPSTIAYADGLPMWSRLADVNIENKPENDLGAVKLLRSIASTDVMVTKTKFVLEEVYLCFGADKGLLPYDHEKIVQVDQGSGPQPQASEPRVVSGMLTDQEWSTTTISSDATSYFVNNYFYMYENATSLAGTHTATASPSKVVVKGKYDNGSSTYYPLTFRRPAATPGGTETKLQVTRNCKYVIVITKVNGNGYGSLEEAKQAEDVNADYEVIEWNMNEDDDIYIDGSKFLSLGGKTATLYRDAGAAYFIPVTTNYAASEILMKYLEANTGVTPTLDTHDRFKIELKTVDGQLGFLFTAKQAYGDGAADDHEASIIVTVGRIKFNIVIRQLDYNPNDWQNGGNTGVDL